LKELTKDELCEALAEDYADRASRGSKEYDEAYQHYLSRCLARKTID